MESFYAINFHHFFFSLTQIHHISNTNGALISFQDLFHDYDEWNGKKRVFKEKMCRFIQSDACFNSKSIIEVKQVKGKVCVCVCVLAKQWRICIKKLFITFFSTLDVKKMQELLWLVSVRCHKEKYAFIYGYRIFTLLQCKFKSEMCLGIFWVWNQHSSFKYCGQLIMNVKEWVLHRSGLHNEQTFLSSKWIIRKFFFFRRLRTYTLMPNFIPLWFLSRQLWIHLPVELYLKANNNSKKLKTVTIFFIWLQRKGDKKNEMEQRKKNNSNKQQTEQSEPLIKISSPIFSLFRFICNTFSAVPHCWTATICIFNEWTNWFGNA